MLLKPVDSNNGDFNVPGATEMIDEQGQCLYSLHLLAWHSHSSHHHKHCLSSGGVLELHGVGPKISSKAYIQKLHRQQCMNNYQFMIV